MTFADWREETAERFRTEPARMAAIESGWKFVNGGIKRTVGPHIGTSIWERADEWDVLVVLDACRVDTMRDIAAEYDWMPDRIGAMWSVGSWSGSWIGRTFDAGHAEHLQTAGYINGNRWGDEDPDWEAALPADIDQLAHYEPIHTVAWREVSGVATVDPTEAVERSIRRWRDREEHGFDHLVTHMMQPHQPFVGRSDVTDESRAAEELDKNLGDNSDCIWAQTRRGEKDRDAVRGAYRDNLRVALDSVEVLVENADARIAITADHGNAMGEFGQWGHPGGSLLPSVRRVPWAVVRGRDTETVEPPEFDIPSVDEAETDEEQLKALGYL